MPTIGLIGKNTADYLSSDATGKSLADQKVNQPYIMDLSTLKRLFLQGLPATIDVSPDTQFATLTTMNSNNPIYHFSSSEDTVKFSISWYADIESQDDVIKKCKWLEALQKTDGSKGIHLVQLAFGDLFKNSKFILVAAPYSIRNPNRELGMLPRLAVQELTFKRVTSKNLTHKDILSINT